MKTKSIFILSILCLLSCTDEKHEFIYGEYVYRAYLSGELQDYGEPDIYDGVVFNDSLFLTHIYYSKVFSKWRFSKDELSKRSLCAGDTSLYQKYVLAIPLNKKYSKLKSSFTSVQTEYITLEGTIDTCIRRNDIRIEKFRVTEDYIEVVECNNGDEVCPIQEAYVMHYIRPNKANQ